VTFMLTLIVKIFIIGHFPIFVMSLVMMCETIFLMGGLARLVAFGYPLPVTAVPPMGGCWEGRGYASTRLLCPSCVVIPLS